MLHTEAMMNSVARCLASTAPAAAAGSGLASVLLGPAAGTALGGQAVCCFASQAGPSTSTSAQSSVLTSISQQPSSATSCQRHSGRLAQPPSSPLGFAASAMQPPSQVHVRGMFIQTQPTPNPHSLMFLPGQKVMESGSKEFSNARAGMASPLAKRLFAIDGVSGVFFGADFITVTKQEDMTWAALKPQVFGAVMDHFASGEPLLLDDAALAASDTAITEDDDEVVAMIKELLETRIRPAVQEDGGDITYRGFDPDTGVVTVKMMGACSGCPSSTVTLKSGIENMLMHYIPEVKGVMEAGPDEHEEEGLKEFSRLEQQLEGKAAS